MNRSKLIEAVLSVMRPHCSNADLAVAKEAMRRMPDLNLIAYANELGIDTVGSEVIKPLMVVRS